MKSLLIIPGTDYSTETYWFPAASNPGNTSDHTPIQKRIFTALPALEELEEIDHQANQKSQEQFFSDFFWTETTLDQQTKTSEEDPLLQFDDTFARHRFHIGINKYFKVKLAPID